MAERRIITKVTLDTGEVVEGVAQVKAHLKSMGETASQAMRRQDAEIRKTEREYRRLVESLDPNIRAQNQYARAVDITNRALAAGKITQAEHTRTLQLAERQHLQASRSAMTLATAVKTIAGSYIALRAVSFARDFIRDSIREWREEAAALRQVEQGLRSTGGAAGMTKAQLRGLADELHRTTNVTDDQALAAESVLLTFTRVNRDVFPQTLRLAADLSARFGGDLNSAVVQLGKAVNDPIAGISALTRVGIQFTDQQKAQIKELVENNRLLEAQRVILAELETQVGGSAAAAQDAFTRIDHSVEQLKGSFGEGLAPAIDQVSGSLSTMAANEESVNYFRNLGAAIGYSIRGFDVLVRSGGSLHRFIQIAAALAIADRNRERASQLNEILTQRFAAGVARLEESKRRQAAAEAAAVTAAKRAAEEREAGFKRAFAAVNKERDEVDRLRRAHELLAGGVPKERVEALLAASRQLGTPNLLDPLVAGLAQAKLQAAALQLRLELSLAAAEKLRSGWAGIKGSKGGNDATKLDEIGKVAAKDFTREWETAWQRYGDYANAAIDNTTATIKSSLIQGIVDGNVEWERVWEDWAARTLSIFFDMVEQMVREWIAAQAAMAAANQAMKASSGGGGGGGGWTSWLGMGANAASTGAAGGAGGGGAAGGASGGGWMAAAGWAAAIVGVLYIAAKYASDRGTPMQKTALGASDGDFALGPTEARDKARGNVSRYMAEQVVGWLNGLLDDLNAQVMKAGAVVVGRKGRGKDAKHFVEFTDAAGNKIVQWFKDIEEAISFAAVQALKSSDLSGLSEEIATAIRNSTAQTMEQMQASVDIGEKVVAARLGDMGSRIAEVWRDAARDMEAAEEHGLAIDGLLAARNREIDAIKASAIGIDTSMAQRLADIASLQAGLAEINDVERARIEEQRSATLRQIELAEMGAREGARLTGETGRMFHEAGEAASRSVEDLREELRKYEEQLAALPKQLSEQEIHAGIFNTLFSDIEGDRRLSRKYEADRVKVAQFLVDLKYEEVRLQLVAMGRWEEFAGMWTDARDAARRAAGRRPGAGSGGAGDARGGVRDFIRDRREQLGLAGAGELARTVADLNRVYRDQLEQAGKDKKLTAELLDLKEKELALARKTAIDSAYAGLRGYENAGNPFAAERDRAAAIQKPFDELFAQGMIGADRYARAIGRVNDQLEENLDRISRVEAAGLLGDLAGLLEAAGLQDDVLHAQVLHAQRVINFILAREDANLRYAVLVAEGEVSKETLATLEKALGIVNGVDPSKWTIPTAEVEDHFRSAADDTARLADDLRKAFRDAIASLKEFTDSLLLDERLTTLAPEQQIAEARRQLAVAEAAARTRDPEAIKRLQQVERETLDVFRRNYASGSEYQAIFDYIIRLNRTLEGLPQYAEGGYIDKKQLAWLHPNEVVIPLAGASVLTGPSPVRSAANDSTAVVRAINDTARQRSAELHELYKKLDSMDRRLASLEAGQSAQKRDRPFPRRTA